VGCVRGSSSESEGRNFCVREHFTILMFIFFMWQVALLGSREYLCVNPKVEALQKSQRDCACRWEVKQQTCLFYNRLPQGKSIIENQLMDMEDLTKAAKNHRFCPFFASRDVQASCNIILLPYNYLFDEQARSSLSVTLDGTLLIVDEGHNVESTCEETSSVAFPAVALVEVIAELSTIKTVHDKREFSTEDLEQLDRFITALQTLHTKVMNLNLKKGTAKKLVDPHFIDSGNFLRSFASEASVSKDFIDANDVIIPKIFDFAYRNQNCFDRTRKMSVAPKGDFRYLSSVQKFLRIAVSVACSTEVQENAYKVFIQDAGSSTSPSRKIHLFCLSGMCAMSEVIRLKPRSLLLTSGTLAPLQELCLQLSLIWADV
jgi:regulator of telomere elongation helicase 1